MIQWINYLISIYLDLYMRIFVNNNSLKDYKSARSIELPIFIKIYIIDARIIIN
jgi:hypothetical protein